MRDLNRIRLLALPILADMEGTTRYSTTVNGVERVWEPPCREEDIVLYVAKAVPYPIECRALAPAGEPLIVVTG